MRRGKLRGLTAVILAGVLLLALLPGAVLAHNWCTYSGAVFCCDNVTAVTAWLEDPYVGPWHATVEATPYPGLFNYRLRIPPDDPNTPGKEGGVLGDTVHFMVTCGSANITAPSATGPKAYATGMIRQYNLDICCPLQGDVNMDGVVDMRDVTKEERIILGYDDATPCADVNGDGKINMADVTAIEWIIIG